MVKSARSPKKLKKLTLKKQFVFLCSCCAVVFTLFVAGLYLDSYIKGRRVLGSQIELEERQLLSQKEQKKYWENFLKENPNYLPGWLELTNIYLEEGEVENARESLSKAKKINPNSPEVKDLQKRLSY